MEKRYPVFFITLAIAALMMGCTGQQTGNSPAQSPTPSPILTTATSAPPATTPFVPYKLESGGNSPAGVVYDYFNSLDQGDYSRAFDTMLVSAVIPADQKAGIVNNFTTASAQAMGIHGENIKLENMTITAQERFDPCGNSTSPDLEVQCRGNLSDGYRFSITMDETSTIAQVPHRMTAEYNVAAVLYKGTWKFLS
jgi:hypothetical protein